MLRCGSAQHWHRRLMNVEHKYSSLVPDFPTIQPPVSIPNLEPAKHSNTCPFDPGCAGWPFHNPVRKLTLPAPNVSKR